jgi:histidinol-phosphate aminotransferase
VTSNYAFVRYRMAAELVGAPVALVPMKAMRHDVKAIARATSSATGMICLDIPCNPTGGMLTTQELEWLLRHVPATTVVLLDQAYYEFCAGQPGCPDGVALAAKWPNLVVTRTFSKAYGLAGLRVGYGLARPEIVADVDRVRPPFNVSRVAQAAALAALGDQAYVRRCVRVNARGLEQLAKGLDRLGLRRWPSHANFILVDLGRLAGPVFLAMQKRGVIARPMAGYGLATCLRISVGTPVENRKCLAALRAALAEPAA